MKEIDKFEIEGFSLIEKIAKDNKLKSINKVFIQFSFSQFLFIFREVIEDRKKEK